MSSNIDVDIVAIDDARTADVSLIGTSCTQKTAASTNQVHEEYKDSLEFNAVIKESNRINDDDDTEGELLDTVEQDSLETTKIESNKLVDGANEFLPFAHIGTSWPIESATSKMNNTQQLNSSTNQIVENVLTNQTNSFDDETNNTITTKQSIEFDFQDLPGIRNPQNPQILTVTFFVCCLAFYKFL